MIHSLSIFLLIYLLAYTRNILSRHEFLIKNFQKQNNITTKGPTRYNPFGLINSLPSIITLTIKINYSG